MATNNSSKRPATTLRCDNIKTTIWENVSEKGLFFATTFSRPTNHSDNVTLINTTISPRPGDRYRTEEDRYHSFLVRVNEHNPLFSARAAGFYNLPAMREDGHKIVSWSDVWPRRLLTEAAAWSNRSD